MKINQLEIFQTKFIFPVSTFIEKKQIFFCKTVDFTISLNHSSLCMLWSLKKLASDTTAIIFHRNSNILTVFFCILNKKSRIAQQNHSIAYTQRWRKLSKSLSEDFNQCKSRILRNWSQKTNSVLIDHFYQIVENLLKSQC